MRSIFTTGYEVEQGFLSSKTCDAIVSEASKLDAESLDCPVDVLASEIRIWRAEQCLSSVNELLSDEFLRPYEELFGQKFSFCIYNEVSPGLVGSGGGWHRDTRFKDQYKILIYLTDCKTRAEGCFKYIPGSQTKLNLYRLLTLIEIFGKPRFKFLANFFNFLGRDLGGSKGDAILVNTTGIHKGNPVVFGHRKALTLYFDNGVKFG